MCFIQARQAMQASCSVANRIRALVCRPIQDNNSGNSPLFNWAVFFGRTDTRFLTWVMSGTAALWYSLYKEKAWRNKTALLAGCSA